MNDTYAQILKERYALSIDRIRQIPGENLTPQPFRAYFHRTAGFLLQMDEVCPGLQKLQERSRSMYEDILPPHYSCSYADPAYAQGQLGETLGRALSFLYVQLRGIIAWNYEGALEETVLHQELFLEIYQMFCQEIPSYHRLAQVLYWFMYDNCDILVTERIRRMLDPEEKSLAAKILKEADLADPSYLYSYGAYISETELALARRLNSLDIEEIKNKAQACADAFLTALLGDASEAADDDKARKRAALDSRKTILIHYQLGQERFVRNLAELLQSKGFRPVYCRAAQSTVNRCGHSLWYEGYGETSPNPQYERDHSEDNALYLDKRFAARRMTVARKALETYKTQAKAFAGIIQLYCGKEAPQMYDKSEKGFTLLDRQKELLKSMKNEGEALYRAAIGGPQICFQISADG